MATRNGPLSVTREEIEKSYHVAVVPCQPHDLSCKQNAENRDAQIGNGKKKAWGSGERVTAKMSTRTGEPRKSERGVRVAKVGRLGETSQIPQL